MNDTLRFNIKLSDDTKLILKNAHINLYEKDLRSGQHIEGLFKRTIRKLATWYLDL